MRLRDRALKAIAQGIFITDPANRSDEPIIYVNAAFERLTGYTQAEVAGRNIEFLRGDRDRPSGPSRDLRSAFRDRREADGRNDLVPQGRYDLLGTPDHGPGGGARRPDQSLRGGHHRRYRAEAAIEQSGSARARSRLRLMIESVRDYAIFAIDLQGPGLELERRGRAPLRLPRDSRSSAEPVEDLSSPEDRESPAIPLARTLPEP